MKAPNAHAKRWQQAVREAGCIITGSSLVHLHHMGGRALRHNKSDIGHYAVLALFFELHDVSSNDPLNVTHHKKAFHREYGSNAKLFKATIDEVLLTNSDDVLPPENIIEAIIDWGKYDYS